MLIFLRLLVVTLAALALSYALSQALGLDWPRIAALVWELVIALRGMVIVGVIMFGLILLFSTNFRGQAR